MFGRKSDSPERKIENTKACNECGCIVRIRKLEQVEYWSSFEMTVFDYCVRCKPPYDRMTYGFGTEVIYERRIPEHFIEVTKEGGEIKPKSPAKKK